MKMTLRWYGTGYDSITLDQIRQIPGLKGVITSLHHTVAGELWKKEDILARKQEVENMGLELSGIESVNIHEDIKIGLPTRDQYIENYIHTLERLGEADIHLVCYNFMPVFDWTRTELAYPLPDGSNALFYDDEVIKGLTPEVMFQRMEERCGGFVLPGWEPNRREEIIDLFEKYKDVTEEKLRANMKYFLDAIMPTCEKYEIKMAVHPDDPAWNLFGLPRIVKSEEDFIKIAEMNSSIYNGFTLCTGSLGSNTANDLVKIIKNPTISNRIHFAHLRNIKFIGDRVFHESAHVSEDGSFDMYQIVKTLYDVGFDGVIRPDHGRMIWNEKARPGYGLYDRALGAVYLTGLWEAIDKQN